jgi:5,10-methylenetetrahydromethanopterin reductase
MRMLHPEGHGAPRPVEVPVLIGAMGPRSDRVARALGDGVLLTGAVPETAAGHPWIGFLAMGTVLEEGEDVTSPRVRATAGPALAVAYHATYELGGDVAALPGGQAWLDVAEAAPEAERHLLVHDHHVVALNAADAAAWDAGAHAALREMTLTGTRDELAARIRALADQGVDELVFQAAGPDPRRELEAFHGVASAALA